MVMVPPPRKRQKTSAHRHAPFVEEITFDAHARQEYLSGFRKRRQQRVKQAQDVAAKKEREHKIVERREIREQRKKDLEDHVNSVNTALKVARARQNGHAVGADSHDSESDGEVVDGSESVDAESSQQLPLEREDEFTDGEHETIVTIEPLELRGGEESRRDEEEIQEVSGRGVQVGTGMRLQRGARTKPDSAKPKKKRKKFRYESKSERKVDRAKQKLKNSAAAKSRREGRN